MAPLLYAGRRLLGSPESAVRLSAHATTASRGLSVSPNGGNRGLISVLRGARQARKLCRCSGHTCARLAGPEIRDDLFAVEAKGVQHLRVLRRPDDCPQCAESRQSAILQGLTHNPCRYVLLPALPVMAALVVSELLSPALH